MKENSFPTLRRLAQVAFEGKVIDRQQYDSYWELCGELEKQFVAAESLNRELVEALVKCKDVLKWLDIQGGLGYQKHAAICEAGELAEAAIKSATAKQGEVGK